MDWMGHQLEAGLCGPLEGLHILLSAHPAQGGIAYISCAESILNHTPSPDLGRGPMSPRDPLCFSCSLGFGSRLGKRFCQCQTAPLDRPHFGYKQQGSAAVEAVITFHPYLSGDKMDLSSISDPLIRSTILGFVSNFGQVPKQVQHPMIFVLLSQECVWG